MSIDDLIDKALNSGGTPVNPSNLYGLVGVPTTGEMFVLNLGDFFLENFRYFLLGEDVSVILLAAYATELDAREAIEVVRETNNLSVAGLIGSAGWHVLMADTVQNNLFTIPLVDYYTGYFTVFQYKTKATDGKVVLQIFTTQEAAEECAEVIRMYMKDAEGNLL